MAFPKKMMTPLFLIVVLMVGFWVYNAFLKTETLELSGVVQAREMKDTSRFGGRVAEVLVNEGDTVKKGQVLVKFDASEWASKLEQSKAALTQAKAEETLMGGRSGLRAAREAVRQAEQTLQLARHGGDADISAAQSAVEQAEGAYQDAVTAQENAPVMLSEGIISQKKFDQIQAQYQQASSQLNAAKAALLQIKHGGRKEQVNIAQSRLSSARAQYQKIAQSLQPHNDIAMASVDQAESQLEGVKKQLDEMEITAKIEGVISILGVLPGDLVLPGQPVVSIIDNEQLWADVYVPEKKMYMVHAGDPVEVRASAFKKNIVFKGRIASINPKSEFVPSGGKQVEDSVFRVKIELPRRDIQDTVDLYPGMGVDVSFVWVALTP